MIAQESERNLVECVTDVMAQLRAFVNAFGSVPRFVRRPARLKQRLLAVGACATFAGALVAGGGAEPASRLGRRADSLRRESTTLAQQRQTALLSLYALDTKLQFAQSRLAALRAQRARVEHERASVRRQLDAAYTTLRVSQRRLAQRLHALYESRESDVFAVLLDASSLEDAI